MAYEINAYKQAAIVTYRQAAVLDPDAFNWPYFRALLIAERGDPEAALDVLDTALAIDGDYAPAWLWRGSWLRGLGRFDEAVAAFERAARLGAETAAQVGVAETFLRRSNPAEALKLLIPLAQKAKDHHAYRLHVYRLLGRARQAIGHEDEARVAAAREVEVNAAPLQWHDPLHAKKWDLLASYSGRLARAEQLLKARSFKAAIEILSPMQETYPDDTVILANLATAVERNGDIERALELIERGLKMNRNAYLFHNALASLRLRQDDDATALAHLRQSIDINPVQTLPYQHMGMTLMYHERYDEALAAFDKALQYGVESPEHILHAAGMIEGARGRWPEAIDRFKQATAVHAAGTISFIYLGRSLAEAHRFKEARAALAWAAKLNTHPVVLHNANVRLAALEKDVGTG